jgi:carboxy-cis,cis-muconate cyclase
MLTPWQPAGTLMASLEPVCDRIHYILSGTFNTVALYLLAFDAVARSLAVISRIDGNGPHQYLGLSPARDRVYTTSWALPPTLAAWAIEPIAGGAPTVRPINQIDISKSCFTFRLLRFR